MCQSWRGRGRLMTTLFIWICQPSSAGVGGQPAILWQSWKASSCRCASSWPSCWAFACARSVLTATQEGSAHPCQDRFGCNTCAMGGIFGLAEALAGAIEHQRGGTPHLHFLLSLVSMFQHCTPGVDDKTLAVSSEAEPAATPGACTPVETATNGSIASSSSDCEAATSGSS